jgi:hypothetical protein
MLQAALDGRKDVTRRPIKWEFFTGQNPEFSGYQLGEYCTGVPESGYVLRTRDGHGLWNDRTEKAKPRHKVGQLVYFKEALIRVGPFMTAFEFDKKQIMQNIDGVAVCYEWRWQRDRLPASSMPAEAARYIARITEVRAERLQEITLPEILKEGIIRRVKSSAQPGASIEATNYYEYGLDHWKEAWWEITAVEAFGKAWNEIYPDKPFDSDPEVWVYGFKMEVGS